MTIRPAPGSGDTLVVMYSGDGGWARLDEALSQDLVGAGLPVVGFDSLRYFWRRRTPQAAAADLAVVLRRYMAMWGRRRIVLIGYSFGADALPAIIPQLPTELRARIRLVALVGVEETGDLQFHPGAWLNLRNPEGYRVADMLSRIRGVPTICIYGDLDAHAACPILAERSIRHLKLAGGHHFGGDAGEVSRAIVAALPR